MRDTIKNRAYFEEYLEVNEKRMERFQNQLQDLPVENIPGRQGCAAFIASLCRSRICALYSSGSDMNAIRDLCPQYVKYLAQAVKPQEGYFDVIDAVSLCTLLEAWECLPDLKTILRQTNMRNKLTDQYRETSQPCSMEKYRAQLRTGETYTIFVNEARPSIFEIGRAHV